MEGVWSEQDTTPSHIEAGLRELLKQRHAEDGGYVPARVLNLVVILDREWRGEIENRLERVGRYHPSRTVMIAVEPRRERLDAWAFMVCEGDASPGSLSVCHEHVVVEVGPRHLRHLDTIVDPLVVSDLSTVVWAPHGHREAVQALRRLAQVVLVDSQDEPDPHLALDRSQQLAQHAYVVDLAWLRSTPWRERIAASFDPPKWREDLRRISAVTVRGEVALELDPEARMDVPGLAGITIRTESGMSLSLDRATGGLSATHRDRRGKESRWTVLGASRGEAGILGEGIRQALLREPTYQPALAAADAMAP